MKLSTSIARIEHAATAIIAVACVMFFAAFANAYAQSRDIPIGPVTQEIAGTPVAFSGVLSLSPAGQQCRSIAATLRVDLQDFASKATSIVKSSGLEKNEDCGDKIAIHGVQVARDGDGLRIRIDGNIGHEQCVKAEVPVVHGFDVRMETKIVARTTIDTNISVAATFAPMIENGTALRLNRAGGVEVHISNDALSHIIQATNLDDRLISHIERSVDTALAADTAQVAMPDGLKGLTARLIAATVVDGPALRVVAEFAIPAGSERVIYGLLGLPVDGC